MKDKVLLDIYILPQIALDLNYIVTYLTSCIDNGNAENIVISRFHDVCDNYSKISFKLCEWLALIPMKESDYVI